MFCTVFLRFSNLFSRQISIICRKTGNSNFRNFENTDPPPGRGETPTPRHSAGGFMVQVCSKVSLVTLAAFTSFSLTLSSKKCRDQPKSIRKFVYYFFVLLQYFCTTFCTIRCGTHDIHFNLHLNFFCLDLQVRPSERPAHTGNEHVSYDEPLVRESEVS